MLADARTIRRFFQTPKGLLILIFIPMIAIAAPHAGWRRVGIELAAAAGFPAAIDALLLRARLGRWEFPSGAILTGLIVAMIISPLEPWYVGFAASMAAIVSKQLFRVQTANVFNPAAFGLVTTYFVFHPAQSWWGALGELPLPFLAVLVAAGIFITARVNKLPLLQSFLGVYFLLYTVTAYVGDPGRVAAMFRPPNLQAVLYFAFFILTDPPTSPVRHRAQILSGALVAVSSFAVFETVRSVYYLLAGVLVGNVGDALRRIKQRAP